MTHDQGEWVHPEIPNPEYKEDKKLHLRAKDVSYVGFELWQVKSGTLFDDIIVTDSLAEAEAFAKETFYKKKDAEKAMFDKVSQGHGLCASRATADWGWLCWCGVMMMQMEEERREKEKAEREEAVSEPASDTGSPDRRATKTEGV